MRAIRPNGASSLEFGLQHHQGCALSHVLAWMTALDRHEVGAVQVEHIRLTLGLKALGLNVSTS